MTRHLRQNIKNGVPQSSVLYIAGTNQVIFVRYPHRAHHDKHIVLYEDLSPPVYSPPDYSPTDNKSFRTSHSRLIYPSLLKYSFLIGQLAHKIDILCFAECNLTEGRGC